jgi:hypothetical protein
MVCGSALCHAPRRPRPLRLLAVEHERAQRAGDDEASDSATGLREEQRQLRVVVVSITGNVMKGAPKAI